MGSAKTLDSTYNIANEMTQKLGFNPQATYAPIIRDTFYQLVPANFRIYYYNAIRRPLHWYQGYVPEVHNPQVGIMATGIGNTVIKELSRLIIGGKVFYENSYGERSNKQHVNQSLKVFMKWTEMYKFQNTLKELVEYSAAGGTSALVSYVNENRDLYVIPYRIDQCFYEVDFGMNVSRFLGFLAYYTAKIDRGSGRSSEDRNFYLVEERYYDDNLKPVKRFTIKESTSNVVIGQSFDTTEASIRKWEQLPKKIQKLLKKDFPDIEFDVEIPIKFTKDLGVDIVRFTTTNRVPEIKMGESALLNVIKYMIDYEYAESALDTDMYLGRGKVLLPEHLKNPTDTVYQSYYGGYDSMIYQQMPMRDLDKQKPISIQFALRIEEWVRQRNNSAEKIASTIGVGGSDIFAYLRDATGSAKTATQIADETRKTLSFVEEKRDIIINCLKPFFQRFKEFYKLQDDVRIKFSSQNLVNKLVTLDDIRVKKEIGLSTYDILREAYPDKDEEQIQEMVDNKFAEMERVRQLNANFDDLKMRKINGRKQGDGIIELEDREEKEEINEDDEKQKVFKQAPKLQKS